jgi:hypothetical protein
VDPGWAAPAPSSRAARRVALAAAGGGIGFDGGEAQERISVQSVSALQNGCRRASEEGRLAGIFTYGFGSDYPRAMTGMLDQLLAEYVAAARRIV